ncbi:MAG: sugar transferase [delta proteobacterium ML8_D]|jgi:glycosyltransferase involved in cell wall biosynthesis|nr:MAG: sugar transferase [delta proteobacterium ML8_D]
MNLAPIVLFVYNRPWHTQQTVKALQKNELADLSDLFIYSDGPKDDQSQETVQKVRKYIHTIDGFKTLTVQKREKNLGLANSIISGVTEIVNKYDRIIVLEDDITTSPYFLRYMNDALNFYQDEERIMHISGYMFPVNYIGLQETFFYRVTSCWGWATWSRAWKYFKKDVKWVYQIFSKEERRAFNLDGSHNFWSQVEGNKLGKLNSWAIFWYASVFKNQGLCLHPCQSLTNNIGHDGSGIHCGNSKKFTVSPIDKPISYFETSIKEDQLALARMKSFYRRHDGNIIQRLAGSLKQKCFYNAVH